MTVQFFSLPVYFFSMCNSYLCLSVVPAVFITLIAVLAAYYISMPVPEFVESLGDNASENMEKFKALGKSAFIVGYTGETGKELVKALAASKVFGKVTLIGRRQVQYDEEMLKDFNVEQKVVDFDNLDESAETFQGHDVGFCCLGTTRGKAGREGFIKVDQDYTLKTAELAKSGGTTHYHLVSSQGANANSSLLYTRIKGEVEQKVQGMGFDKLSIYRPGVLLCEREEKRGLGEWMARKIMAPIDKLSPGLSSTPTTTLATAMLHVAAGTQPESFFLYDGKNIHRASISKQK